MARMGHAGKSGNSYCAMMRTAAKAAGAAVLAAGLMLAPPARAQTCPPSVSDSEAGIAARARYEKAVRQERDVSALRRSAGSPHDEPMEIATFISVDAEGRARAGKTMALCGLEGRECKSQPVIGGWGQGMLKGLSFPRKRVPEGGCVISVSVPIPLIDLSGRDAKAPGQVKIAPAARPAPLKSEPAGGGRFGLVGGKRVPLTEKGFVDLPTPIEPRTPDEAELDVVPHTEMVVSRDGYISHLASREQVDSFRARGIGKAPDAPVPAMEKSPCSGTEFQSSGVAWLAWNIYNKGIRLQAESLKGVFSGASEAVIRLRVAKGGGLALMENWLEGRGGRVDGSGGSLGDIQPILDSHPLRYSGPQCEAVIAVPLEADARYSRFRDGAALRKNR